MPTESRTVSPGRRPGTVRTADGNILRPPATWALLAPGDAALTRRVKAAGPHWVVQKKKGRRMFSQGVWALAETIESCKQALIDERDTDTYKKKLAASRARSAATQEAYVDEFEQAILTFLGFHARYTDEARAMARLITAHATPVGSNTVARTKRIPVADRAGSAVIAWMRHQTTAYDIMSIARIKGERREVRRKLAQKSKQLLASYRGGQDIDGQTCPLAKALDKARAAQEESSS